MAAVGLLVAGIAAMFLRPFRLPLWVGPVAAAAIGLATQVIHWHDASDSLHLLTKPLLFLLFAVPLAIVLDRIGVFAALGTSRLLRSMLFEVSPNDPLVLAASGAVLIVVTAVATLAPARRATRIDPVEAMRA